MTTYLGDADSTLAQEWVLPADRMVATAVEAPDDIDTITGLFAYLSKVDDGRFLVRGWIAEDDGSGLAPSDVVPDSQADFAMGGSKRPNGSPNNGPDWFGMRYDTPPTLTPGDTYWIVINAQIDDTTIYYDDAPGAASREGSWPYGTAIPDPWDGDDGAIPDITFEVYIEYEEVIAASSTDIVYVYQREDEKYVWYRKDENGDLISEATDAYDDEDTAIEAAQTDNPGVVVTVRGV